MDPLKLIQEKVENTLELMSIGKDILSKTSTAKDYDQQLIIED